MLFGKAVVVAYALAPSPAVRERVGARETNKIKCHDPLEPGAYMYNHCMWILITWPEIVANRQNHWFAIGATVHTAFHRVWELCGGFFCHREHRGPQRKKEKNKKK